MQCNSISHQYFLSHRLLDLLQVRLSLWLLIPSRSSFVQIPTFFAPVLTLRGKVKHDKYFSFLLFVPSSCCDGGRGKLPPSPFIPSPFWQEAGEHLRRERKKRDFCLSRMTEARQRRPGDGRTKLLAQKISFRSAVPLILTFLPYCIRGQRGPHKGNK